jgi:regulator of sirC expression with transglutaminase-like and TPR domain
VDPTARFAELVTRPDSEISLDEAALLIAARVRHRVTVDVDARLQELDALAWRGEGIEQAGALARWLFVDEGFAGNRDDYGDPRNSCLDAVLDRRLGLPITLSVLMIEVGRRLGITVRGVGMPGHFLVSAGPAEWYDPFNGGVRLDFDGCVARFRDLHPDGALRPRDLAPVGARAILDRMLANLQNTLAERDQVSLVEVVRLRLRIPSLAAARRAELARVLGRLGQFPEAARELTAAAGGMRGEAAERVRREATELRARAN